METNLKDYDTRASWIPQQGCHPTKRSATAPMTTECGAAAARCGSEAQNTGEDAQSAFSRHKVFVGQAFAEK